ncbi:sialin-like isoform X2 [Eriocheir sinensis]|uniref:sialin-like isoform X2 n=1 Tax=Eriocheir sinensis TaxID=95602 RepID=UPI0021C96662|nr:sialin-like isoform X2 [Eriocheir sinensis]
MCRGWRDQVEEGVPETEVILPSPQPSGPCGCRVGIRHVVVVLGLLGCMLDYLMRFGLSVAIVAMVNTTVIQPVGNHSVTPDHACPAALNGTSDDPMQGEGEFLWTVKEQGMILGTFFWGYFFTKTIGGRISELVGARETMAVSIGVSGLLCLLSPTFAYINPLALATLRFVMGMVQGPSFPALYCVLLRWAPPDKLATMTTIAFSGMSLGSVVAMGSSQWVVEHLGWQWVFWGAGAVAILWTPFWLYFVRNSPCSHPLMSSQEAELLAPNLVIKPKIGMNMEEVSFVLTVGQACSWVSAFSIGRLSDWFIQSCHLKKANTRRLIHSIGMVGVVVGLVSVVLAGCNKWLVAAMLMVAMIGSPATLSSFTLTPMDIAPNYAGTLSGMLGIGNISGFLAPLITAEMVIQTGGWDASILLGAVIYMLAGLLYLATVTTEVQEWNDYDEILDSDDSE